jgi:DNA helicase-2/ATP-dependent DNA helicase PcrA
MLTRLSAMLPVNVRGMWIGTFHGLCNRFLRAHWKLAGLPQGFQILDSRDQLAAVKRIDQGDEPRRGALRAQAGDLVHRRPQGRGPAPAPTWTHATSTRAASWWRCTQAYEAQCQREGVVDFAELMLRTYELMRDNDALREHYQRRFRHVLVDEFQDTNRLQYAWLKMFAPPGPTGQGVFAVGDDDQSIYAFRGALVGNMADFEREYRVPQVIKLEQNYRSFGHILDSANPDLAHNSARLGKNLRTDAGAGEPVRVYEAASDYAEAQWLLDEAQQLHRGGIARQEIAMLYRSNAQSRVLESALFNAGMPVPRLRRPALLRAGRGQARAGLPAPDREPQRRHQLPARGELPGARHRRAHGGATAGRGAQPAGAAWRRAWARCPARAAPTCRLCGPGGRACARPPRA